ncbi:hypothetical protein A3A14_00370 [Candidatus Daviesbacteria bacterium RIFCSPLOWO2_01_FULL_43_38]|uniref:Uncharacterized protein n=3 Tax=Candidatus Daviesiibacteriota TaxID=1752718 RepID=A0A1F5K745_9BACT|nr:MAG: hypothetical protein UV33_C0019G0003 [Candidatus Daviesbacteria bacterium GW2011_GWA1_42_6]KKS69850.1 MAG: hypothetical protein UV41_C0044G0010 [Candidatus Daviesbacteria bacterium GW2011_GWA2_42_7]OGE20301.1 MAG: hypothetical protein A2874_03965 [Candidatus Daviesbacteria bacterium RIFCSPHIGHO2_01_FULL_43_17]OGE36664.1 MAG: hypothetical protein A3E45_02740 [Candidatus Daviesbacteria bacterium RIFCSPHIGHO2_12_FULL_43_11]OGE63239.1 MAG: hypothetical protein A3A14_00370 [Candidatus Davies
MGKENPHEQFNARTQEAIARMKLSAEQVKQVREQNSRLVSTAGETIDKQSLLKSIYQLANTQEVQATIVTDAYWINALLAVGIPTNDILKAWDVKDDLSRNTKDFIREQLEKEKGQE